METLKWIISSAISLLAICAVVVVGAILAAVGASASLILVGIVVVVFVAAAIKEGIFPDKDKADT